ncbi:MAG TPA: beta-N-acetylhexosaminidase [Arsenicitalea sp.]|jgi:hexosaminidase|nr:beta-N-acetylhexosaminidase [Arsenicitalea sp.]
MTASPRFSFGLETIWSPANSAEPMSYALKLTNQTGAPVKGFRLCVSGPARIDPAARIAGGELSARLSNHAEFSPPMGLVLKPGETWTVTANTLLRHWNDGANAAYVRLADGSIASVAVSPTRSVGDHSERKKGTVRFPVPVGGAPVSISVIPWPASVSVVGERAVPAGLDLRAQGSEANEAAMAFAELTAALFPAEGLVRPAAEGGLPVHLELAAGLGAEAYRIAFEPEQVRVRAATHAGFLYGLITLGQIVRGAKLHPQTFVFPASGEIDDAPGLQWRGSHLDVARQFFSSAEISQYLRILAWNKLNRFHWHLSDDEAWRIEIDAYPALTTIGAWRGHGLPIPALLGSGAAPSGGFYSKAAVRDIVALAGRLGVTVIPEIDVPGHCFAMQQAIPELRDPEETGTYFSVQGFPNNCLNPAREETYKIVETIFDELIELFPSKIFHIGADEVPLAAWSGSPAALKRLGEIGGAAAETAHRKLLNSIGNTQGADEIEGSGAAALQAVFLARIQTFLASRGCITGGWEEAAHGNVIDKTKSYLVGWRNVEVSAALAGEGYDMVVAPGQRYYLDMANSDAWSEPGAGWAGWSGPRETYAFDPTTGWTEAQKQHLLGIQACIWSEPMADRAIFDRLVFQRLSAIAETGWTPPEAKSWERFSALAGLMPNLYGNWAE